MAVESTQSVKVQTPAAPASEVKKDAKSKPAEVVGTAAAIDAKAAPTAKAPTESPVANATKAPGQGEKIDVKA